MSYPKSLISNFVFFTIIIFLASCSAYLAAQKGGVPVENIMQCKTRAELLSNKDVEVIESVKNSEGEIEETCRVMKEKGSYGRAAVNTVMTVFSLGIWEIASYPGETMRTENKAYYNVKVYYDKQENIQKIELLN